uniref:Uncharacterized protein n=1 Tax=Anguilla anguilla TaxID=7936 RepID=A0A0E9T3F4_ANGAN
MRWQSYCLTVMQYWTFTRPYHNVLSAQSYLYHE